MMFSGRYIIKQVKVAKDGVFDFETSSGPIWLDTHKKQVKIAENLWNYFHKKIEIPDKGLSYLHICFSPYKVEFKSYKKYGGDTDIFYAFYDEKGKELIRLYTFKKEIKTSEGFFPYKEAKFPKIVRSDQANFEETQTLVIK